ncbi:MAG: 4Fe-4S dicluster domain-containing protein [Desulfobacteraceae bacterium]|nr:MAG: 4Fe-4S dicluster domain-containing protein [Desulfobacteraceae bacterium]
MKIAALVFSPAGKTRETAARFEKTANRKGFQVTTIDWTGSKRVFREGRRKEFLEREIPEHDILCVFSPVYVHHLSCVVQELLSALPKPGGKWGPYAVPVVTFGGGSSGDALLEAAKILIKTKRTVMAALKVEAEHCITRIKPILTKINAGKPGEDLDPVLEKLADHLRASEGSGQIDTKTVLARLRYQSKSARLKNRFIFREKFWQRYIYPKLGIDRALCIACGACAKQCPVRCLEMETDGPVLTGTQKRCIHCAGCVMACPTGALRFRADWEHWNRVVDRLAKGQSPLYTEEKPNTALFTF